MSYVNAENVLPADLVKEIQKYVDGQLIYIPRKQGAVLSWGEKSGWKDQLAERNRKIVTHYDSGKSIPEISELYYLSEKRIQSIIREYESSKQKKIVLEEKIMNKVIIRKEERKDFRETELMTMRAFWNIHGPGCNEHLMVRMIRESEDYIPEISRVAELNGKIVGAIYYTKAKIVEDQAARDTMSQAAAPCLRESRHLTNAVHPAERDDIITFGPLAVEPTLFGMGIGKALLNETIELAKKEGYSGIVLAGEPYYYPKLGFQRCEKYGITDAHGETYDALMCLPLKDDFLSVHGRLIESTVFESCDDQEALHKMSEEFPRYPKLKIKEGFLQIFEKHIGVVEAFSEDSYQIRFWELLIPAHLSKEIKTAPKVGEYVLFIWKKGDEAEITDMIKPME